MKKVNLLVLAIIGFVFVGITKVNAEEAIVSTKEELITCLTEGTADTCKIGNNIDGITEKITISKNVTIDLNGNTISFYSNTYAIEIGENKEVTIKDSSEEKKGIIKNVHESGDGILLKGTLILENGRIESENTTIDVYDNFIMKNGKVISNSDGSTTIDVTKATATVIIENGEVAQNCNSGYDGYGIGLDFGKLTIVGGTIMGYTAAVSVQSEDAIFDIKGGLFLGKIGGLIYIDRELGASSENGCSSLTGGKFVATDLESGIGGICIAGRTSSENTDFLPTGYMLYKDRDLNSIEGDEDFFVYTSKEVRVVKKTGYNISTSVAGGKGTIKDSFIIKYASSNDDIEEDVPPDGKDALITFQPDNGYEIGKVLVNGVDMTKEVKDGKLTIKEVFRDYNVEVIYSLIENGMNAPIVENPKTIDSIVVYFIITIISIVGIISVFTYKKRYN